MQTGRKQETVNPFATIDWLAYQGAPRDGLTGKVQLQKWWSGTNCADVTFPKVRFETFFYFKDLSFRCVLPTDKRYKQRSCVAS